MKISLNWLKEYVDFNLPVDDLASRLTDAGLEVASITQAGGGIEGVVVGEIVAVSKHPQADKLSVCQVAVGKENLQMVCGAPNVAEKSKVPVALVGTRLPGGIQIQKSTLRGEDSYGMICSEKELEIGEVEEGIMILDPGLKVGQSLSSALGLEDWIFDIELTPNRSDCLSIIGVARDVAALCGTHLKKPEIKPKEKGTGSAKDQVGIEIQDPQACPRYTARVIEEIKIKESPFWLKRKLYSAGMRPINNVVDISNLVMLEWGHPLHAFDYHLFTPHGKKDERKVVVRRAKKGEKFVTLDEIERTLNEEVLLITDGKVAVAIGGIMGGLKSEVASDTHTVLLESAYFDPQVIRRGRMFLGLSTESSQRFERGADPNGVVNAADRAAELLELLAEGKVQKGIVDSYPSPIHPVQITLRPKRVNQLLDTDMDTQSIKEILTALEMEVKENQNLDVRAPTFRPDLTREIDLIEEIARIYGYSNINTSLRASGSLVTKIHREDKLAMEVKHFLSANGCYEVITNNLVDPDLLEKIYPQSNRVAIQNPLSRDLSVLSTTLAYGLLGVVSRNKNHLEKNVRIFELAKVFFSGNDQLPDERMHLGIAISGDRQPRHWESGEGEVDLYDLKGILEALFNHLKMSFKLRSGKSSLLLPERSFHVLTGEEEIGILGEVSKEAQTAFGIKDKIFWAELDFDRIVDLVPPEIQLSPLPKFPPVERDIAVVADEGLLSEKISMKIKELGGTLIEEVTLFDVYKGKQVPPGKKSLAYSIRYRSREKTLTDEEVEEIHRKVISGLKEFFSVTLRD